MFRVIGKVWFGCICFFKCFYVFLTEILIQFDLDEHKESLGIENDINIQPKWKLKDINKIDNKMYKLWHQAELAGFTSNLF